MWRGGAAENRKLSLPRAEGRSLEEESTGAGVGEARGAGGRRPRAPPGGLVLGDLFCCQTKPSDPRTFLPKTLLVICFPSRHCQLDQGWAEPVSGCRGWVRGLGAEAGCGGWVQRQGGPQQEFC